jgi:hypothetical protein
MFIFEYFKAIWYIFPFWYVVPRKIWQPWQRLRRTSKLTGVERVELELCKRIRHLRQHSVRQKTVAHTSLENTQDKEVGVVITIFCDFGNFTSVWAKTGHFFFSCLFSVNSIRHIEYFKAEYRHRFRRPKVLKTLANEKFVLKKFQRRKMYTTTLAPKISIKGQLGVTRNVSEKEQNAPNAPNNELC